MTAAPELPRRGLAAVLGLAMAVPGDIQALPALRRPATRLADCWARLRAMDGEFAKLPDSHPRQVVLIESIDILLGQAAAIRPETPEAFAIKARIVQVYGDCPAGQMVADYLLCDLMAQHEHLFT